MNIEIKPFDSQRSTDHVTTPKIPFSMYICASKGGGKSTLILNMLKKNELLKKKFNRIYWISPTIHLDEKITKQLEENLTIPNTDLKNKIRSLTKNKNKNVLQPLYDLQEDGLYFIEKLTTKFIEDTINENKKLSEEFGKKYADNILLILDDMIESKIFKTETMRKLLFKSRHYKVSIITTSQSYFQLPKALRLNQTYIILFETGSKKELERIYEENNAGFKYNEFFDMIRILFDIPYNFLIINYNNPKMYRFSEQFKQFIQP